MADYNESTPLTDLERELLTMLIEECAEVQQRATKALRFGLDEVQDGQPHNNADRLSEEFGDLLAVARMCYHTKIMSTHIVSMALTAKMQKVNRFMKHA